MNEIKIPRYIDAQPQLFWWEFDEAVAAVALFSIGVVTETLSFMLLMIFFLPPALKRVKENALDGTLNHVLYWFGALPLNKEFDDAMRKEYFL